MVDKTQISISMVLAQHYFLDALDLHSRFRAHWEDQPRRSSRVKSFVDLLMACECLLKAQYIMAHASSPLSEVYAEIRKLGHSIRKLSRAIGNASPDSAQARAGKMFGKFNVRLRYSVDAHEYFFPIDGPVRTGPSSYDSTLGSQEWMQMAESVVLELIEWGRSEFNGEINTDIVDIRHSVAEVECIVRGRKPR